MELFSEHPQLQGKYHTKEPDFNPKNGKFYLTFWNDDGSHFNWYIPFPQLYHINPLERPISEGCELNLTIN
jgi:hypothetical protein